MMDKDKQMLIQSLFDIGVFQWGDYTLKSGEKSSLYINLRKTITYPAIIRLTAKVLWQAIKDKNKDSNFKFICGVPYTALPIATCLSLVENIPMLLRRREKKNYGTKQSIEGDYHAGDSCLIIEDVITSGMSILETIHDLEAAQLQVNHVVILIDREQKRNPTLSKYSSQAVFTITEIFNFLTNANLLNKQQIDIFKQFIRNNV